MVVGVVLAVELICGGGRFDWEVGLWCGGGVAVVSERCNYLVWLW